MEDRAGECFCAVTTKSRTLARRWRYQNRGGNLVLATTPWRSAVHCFLCRRVDVHGGHPPEQLRAPSRSSADSGRRSSPRCAVQGSAFFATPAKSSSFGGALETSFSEFCAFIAYLSSPALEVIWRSVVVESDAPTAIENRFSVWTSDLTTFSPVPFARAAFFLVPSARVASGRAAFAQASSPSFPYPCAGRGDRWRSSFAHPTAPRSVW